MKLLLSTTNQKQFIDGIELNKLIITSGFRGKMRGKVGYQLRVIITRQFIVKHD